MSNLVKRTIKHLISLGLNVESGVSPVIHIKDLECLSKDRHTSNGCRVVRDDNAPFSFFKITRHYEGKSLVSIQFNGYRDVEYEFYALSDKITFLEEKLESLQSLLNCSRREQEFLLNCDSKNSIWKKRSFLLYLIVGV